VVNIVYCGSLCDDLALYEISVNHGFLGRSKPGCTIQTMSAVLSKPVLMRRDEMHYEMSTASWPKSFPYRYLGTNGLNKIIHMNNSYDVLDALFCQTAIQ
jgi:hypothetical protein